jgi:toxin secretion/phage lysis holin
VDDFDWETVAMHPITDALLLWVTGQPLLGALFLLMLMDIVMGMIAAYVTRELSSTVSWVGMLKKSGVLVIIGLGAVIQPFAGDLPLAKMVSMFFIFHESLSIIENAARAGIPLPAQLLETLEKIKPAQAVPPKIVTPKEAANE